MCTDDEELLQEKDIPVIYVNTFRIGYDAYKFALELGSILLTGEEPTFTIRVVMGPDTAKAFLETFGQLIKKYEYRLGHMDIQD